MDDAEIVARIAKLVEEEHGFEKFHPGHQLDAAEQERRRHVEVALDQCWDLLRQRRARREMGQDPDNTAVRPERVVEGYQQ